MNLQGETGSSSQRIVSEAKEFEFGPEANMESLKSVKPEREGLDWICV